MNALVIGGTGPTGPFIVDGLLDRGYKVTILHSGSHEAEFKGPVEDIHADASFAETLQEALGNRTFDLVSCQYGRLRMAAEFFQNRTGRFIGVGAPGRGHSGDPKWGPLDRPAIVDESAGSPDPADKGITSRIYMARERVLELHNARSYNTTYIGHPETYGPRQHSPAYWCVVKRILDGRKQLIIADGGVKLSQRAYGENCAQSVLLSVDKPNEAAGQYFNVSERPLYTERQRIDLIARVMGVELELVSMPFEQARSANYQWLRSPAHNVNDDSKIRRMLGYKEVVEPGEAHVRTIKWIVDNAKRLSEEWENQMEDTFDYEAEDKMIRVWKEACEKLDAIPMKSKIPAHAYRHPSKPNEPWRRPEDPEHSIVAVGRKVQYY